MNFRRSTEPLVGTLVYVIRTPVFANCCLWTLVSYTPTETGRLRFYFSLWMCCEKIASRCLRKIYAVVEDLWLQQSEKGLPIAKCSKVNALRNGRLKAQGETYTFCRLTQAERTVRAFTWGWDQSSSSRKLSTCPTSEHLGPSGLPGHSEYARPAT